jgi:glycosyltransferase involved in cell wall biosynthesis
MKAPALESGSYKKRNLPWQLSRGSCNFAYYEREFTETGMPGGRFAVVTPYYKEDRPVLERCIASVKAQIQKTDHILVADGFPQDWVGGAGVRHVVLDRAHGDYGNAARGVGALLAVAESYDGIGFLDADNWLDKDHVALCVETGARAPRPDLVVAKRRYVRPNGSMFPLVEEDNHVDTNCWWFQPGAYHLLPHWVTIPREMASVGDRVFYWPTEASKLSRREVARTTVNYTCMWEGIYRFFGEAPPPGAKPDIDLMPVLEWICSLTEEWRPLVAKLCGGDLTPWAQETLQAMKAARSGAK